jgi:hypothetical protein
MRTARLTALACLVAASAGAAGFMAKPKSGYGDMSSCYGLGSADDRLRTAFAKGSTFPDMVYNAFAGQGSGDATAGDYLTRGQDLFQLVDTVAAQCRATFAPGSNPPEQEAAPIRRRVQSAKHTADLYLDLPNTIAKIDAYQNPADLALRPQFLTAMYKIADGGNYEAAAALADQAHADQARIRR